MNEDAHIQQRERASATSGGGEALHMRSTGGQSAIVRTAFSRACPSIWHRAGEPAGPTYHICRHRTRALKANADDGVLHLGHTHTHRPAVSAVHRSRPPPIRGSTSASCRIRARALAHARTHSRNKMAPPRTRVCARAANVSDASSSASRLVVFVALVMPSDRNVR